MAIGKGLIETLVKTYGRGHMKQFSSSGLKKIYNKLQKRYPLSCKTTQNSMTLQGANYYITYGKKAGVEHLSYDDKIVSSVFCKKKTSNFFGYCVKGIYLPAQIELLRNVLPLGRKMSVKLKKELKNIKFLQYKTQLIGAKIHLKKLNYGDIYDFIEKHIVGFYM